MRQLSGIPGGAGFSFQVLAIQVFSNTLLRAKSGNIERLYGCGLFTSNAFSAFNETFKNRHNELIPNANANFTKYFYFYSMSTRLQQLQQMLAQEPNDEFLQYAIAMEYFSAGEFQKAIEILEKILADNKNY